MRSAYIIFACACFVAMFLAGGASLAAPKLDPPQQFFPVHDYRNDWLVYSGQYKNYVPFSQGVNEGSSSVSLYIDLEKNLRYSLLLQTDHDAYLFLDGALQSKLEQNQWRKLKLDSLFKIYKKTELLLTIYGNPGIQNKTALLCHEKSAADSSVISGNRSSFINIKPITFSPFGNFSVIVLIIVLILNAWVFNVNPLSFLRLINPIEFFNGDPRDQLSKINKPYGLTISFFVIVSSMLMSYLIMFFSENNLNLFSVNSLLSEQSNTWMAMSDFFILTIIFFVLAYLKYVCMSVAGNMLNLDKSVDVLFVKIVQSSYMFYGGLFLLAFAFSFNHLLDIAGMKSFILIPFLFFYSARFVALYLVTKPVGSLINLYLFSYLCVIEIIPLIVSMKFAL